MSTVAAKVALSVELKEAKEMLTFYRERVAFLRAAVKESRLDIKLQKIAARNAKTAEREAKAFIQNIHHFRDDNLKTEKVPIEKVVVFDEAQRAWQKEQVSKFMKTKKGIDDFEMSEPEYLISVMNRHED